jgi:hypothetical protein
MQSAPNAAAPMSSRMAASAAKDDRMCFTFPSLTAHLPAALAQRCSHQFEQPEIDT